MTLFEGGTPEVVLLTFYAGEGWHILYVQSFFWRLTAMNRNHPLCFLAHKLREGEKVQPLTSSLKDRQIVLLP